MDRRHYDMYTGVAQLVEHEAFNLRVAGSSPAVGIFLSSFYLIKLNSMSCPT